MKWLVLVLALLSGPASAQQFYVSARRDMASNLKGQSLMKALAAAALAAFLTAPAFAQTPNPEFQAAAIQVLINQRNAAQNEAAQAEASVDVLNKKMADLQKQIDDFKSKDKPQPSPTPSLPSGTSTPPPTTTLPHS